GALTGYSAVLPAGARLDTLRLVYIRENSGFRYEYKSGAIEELFSDRRVLHGPDTSYIGHFSGMTRLNAFPPKHFVLNDAASYEAGFTVKAVIAEMETGEYTLTLTADGGNASISDVILSYDVMMDATYVPIPKLIVILLEGSGVLSPESLSLTCQSGGVQKNAVSDSAGIISGDGSGTFVTDQYRIEFTPSALPDDGRLSFLYKENIETNDDGRKSTLPMISADDIIIIKDGSNEELALVDTVNHTSKRVYLKGPLLHSYSSGAPAAGVLMLGDLYAQASAPKFYASWDPDDWVGSGTPNDGNFNFVDYPLELSNAGCVEEDWIIEFTSTAEFNVTGRSRGTAGTGDITSDTAVACDGSTYFILRFAGFSGAWQVGEGFSFHTYGNTASMWCIRGVQHGSSLSGTDSVKLIYGGDV
ncbi:MAG: hypothetical protein GY862_13570, partial [Gammaproteobacteria bacterium]|nr:hypothetical protein [Gammaproteobacteria bacterium]